MAKFKDIVSPQHAKTRFPILTGGAPVYSGYNTPKIRPRFGALMEENLHRVAAKWAAWNVNPLRERASTFQLHRVGIDRPLTTKAVRDVIQKHFGGNYQNLFSHFGGNRTYKLTPGKIDPALARRQLRGEPWLQGLPWKFRKEIPGLPRGNVPFGGKSPWEIQDKRTTAQVLNDTKNERIGWHNDQFRATVARIQTSNASIRKIYNDRGIPQDQFTRLDDRAQKRVRQLHKEIGLHTEALKVQVYGIGKNDWASVKESGKMDAAGHAKNLGGQYKVPGFGRELEDILQSRELTSGTVLDPDKLYTGQWTKKRQTEREAIKDAQRLGLSPSSAKRRTIDRKGIFKYRMSDMGIPMVDERGQRILDPAHAMRGGTRRSFDPSDRFAGLFEEMDTIRETTQEMNAPIREALEAEAERQFTKAKPIRRRKIRRYKMDEYNIGTVHGFTYQGARVTIKPGERFKENLSMSDIIARGGNVFDSNLDPTRIIKETGRPIKTRFSLDYRTLRRIAKRTQTTEKFPIGAPTLATWLDEGIRDAAEAFESGADPYARLFKGKGKGKTAYINAVMQRRATQLVTQGIDTPGTFHDQMLSIWNRPKSGAEETMRLTQKIAEQSGLLERVGKRVAGTQGLKGTSVDELWATYLTTLGPTKTAEGKEFFPFRMPTTGKGGIEFKSVSMDRASSTMNTIAKALKRPGARGKTNILSTTAGDIERKFIRSIEQGALSGGPSGATGVIDEMSEMLQPFRNAMTSWEMTQGQIKESLGDLAQASGVGKYGAPHEVMDAPRGFQIFHKGKWLRPGTMMLGNAPATTTLRVASAKRKEANAQEALAEMYDLIPDLDEATAKQMAEEYRIKTLSKEADIVGAAGKSGMFPNQIIWMPANARKVSKAYQNLYGMGAESVTMEGADAFANMNMAAYMHVGGYSGKPGFGGMESLLDEHLKKEYQFITKEIGYDVSPLGFEGTKREIMRQRIGKGIEDFFDQGKEWTLFDTETTRLHTVPGSKRQVFEIGALKMKGRSRTGDYFHRFIDVPEMDINPITENLTRMDYDTRELLRKAGKLSTPQEAISAFSDYTAESPLGAWNGIFDDAALKETIAQATEGNPALKRQLAAQGMTGDVLIDPINAMRQQFPMTKEMQWERKALAKKLGTSEYIPQNPFAISTLHRALIGEPENLHGALPDVYSVEAILQEAKRVRDYSSGPTSLVYQRPPYEDWRNLYGTADDIKDIYGIQGNRGIQVYQKLRGDQGQLTGNINVLDVMPFKGQQVSKRTPKGFFTFKSMEQQVTAKQVSHTPRQLERAQYEAMRTLNAANKQKGTAKTVTSGVADAMKKSATAWGKMPTGYKVGTTAFFAGVAGLTLAGMSQVNKAMRRDSTFDRSGQMTMSANSAMEMEETRTIANSPTSVYLEHDERGSDVRARSYARADIAASRIRQMSGQAVRRPEIIDIRTNQSTIDSKIRYGTYDADRGYA